MAATPRRPGRRRTLATNVTVGDTTYGPSYPENGEPPADVNIPDSAYDVRANWATPDDAARAGVDWPGDDLPPPSNFTADEGT